MNQPVESRPIHLSTHRDQAQRSIIARTLHTLWHDRTSMVAVFVLVALTIISIAGPPVLDKTLNLDATSTHIRERYLLPGEESHILGTDNLGRDQLARLMMGGRISLSIAYFTSIIATIIGITLGITSGYFGGFVDDLIIWFIATLSSVPTLFLLLVAASLWSPSPPTIIIILALLGWIDMARLVRGEVFSLLGNEYVLAARSLGASSRRIMVTHLLPNLLPMVIVHMTILAATLILIESSLSFLGLGVQPPTPSWGNMLTDARLYFAKGRHLMWMPGILIAISVACLYLIGDGLRDALDPRYEAEQRIRK